MNPSKSATSKIYTVSYDSEPCLRTHETVVLREEWGDGQFFLVTRYSGETLWMDASQLVAMTPASLMLPPTYTVHLSPVRLVCR